ncbi:hypothetical protein GH733_004498 [Mirounga leonina]|nr:hypothetical protein GH733_004498 [Mirounga leonina]
MAEAGKEPAGLALPGGGAAQWPLQRYGRFMPSGPGEPPGPGQDAGTASSPTWKVFDSSEESGYLVLTIVISGHFFISQGQTLLCNLNLTNPELQGNHFHPRTLKRYGRLSSAAVTFDQEGFSLIGSKNWLKITSSPASKGKPSLEDLTVNKCMTRVTEANFGFVP